MSTSRIALTALLLVRLTYSSTFPPVPTPSHSLLLTASPTVVPAPSSYCSAGYAPDAIDGADGVHHWRSLTALEGNRLYLDVGNPIPCSGTVVEWKYCHRVLGFTESRASFLPGVWRYETEGERYVSVVRGTDVVEHQREVGYQCGRVSVRLAGVQEGDIIGFYVPDEGLFVLVNDSTATAESRFLYYTTSNYFGVLDPTNAVEISGLGRPLLEALITRGTASPIAVSPTPSHQPAPGSSFNRTALLLGVLGSCVLLALATAVCIAFMFVLRSLYKHRHSTNNITAESEMQYCAVYAESTKEATGEFGNATAAKLSSIELPVPSVKIAKSKSLTFEIEGSRHFIPPAGHGTSSLNLVHVENRDVISTNPAYSMQQDSRPTSSHVYDTLEKYKKPTGATTLGVECEYENLTPHGMNFVTNNY